MLKRVAPRWRQLTSWSEIGEPDTADLFGPELVGRQVKILGELADDPEIGFCGTMGVITALSF